MLNLTQHAATPEQQEAGVTDLPPEARQQLIELLTFDQLPNSVELINRAAVVAQLAQEFGNSAQAMIGGAPYFMRHLERALLDQEIEPVYAFSTRDSREETQTDGSVRKVAVFRHSGFYRPYSSHFSDDE